MASSAVSPYTFNTVHILPFVASLPKSYIRLWLAATIQFNQ
jgi:hypothetical protein